MFPENIKKESEDDTELVPFEHIIKLEPETFDDFVVLGKTEEATVDCKLDVGPKAFDRSMNPVVVLKCLNDETVSFWTKWKTTATNLTTHASNPAKKQVRPNIMATCNVCGIKKRRDLILKHMKIHENKRQECPRCHKLYANLYCHLRHCQKEIGCVHCGEVLEGKKALRLHKMTVHSEGPFYYCHCGEVFKKRKSMVRHRRDVHSSERFSCTQCDKSYGDKGTLLQHWKILHRKKHGPFNQASEHYKHFDPALNHKGPYFCDYCGKDFPIRRNIYQHIRTQHIIEKAMLCDLCPVSFRRKFELERHIIGIHLKTKSLVCKVCGYKTSTKGILQRHKKIHQKKTKCPKCNRLIPNLSRHLYICNKTKPCPICKKEISLNNFAQHKKIHIKNQIEKFYKDMA